VIELANMRQILHSHARSHDDENSDRLGCSREICTMKLYTGISFYTFDITLGCSMCPHLAK
jgi:hypothetical protein